MRGFGPQRGHRGSEQADVAFANVSHESPTISSPKRMQAA